MARRSSNKPLYLLIAVLFLITAGFQARRTVEVLDVLIHPDDRAQAGIALFQPWPTVVFVAPEAAAGGLRRGDRVLSLEGKPLVGLKDLSRVVKQRRPGQVLRLEIQRPDGSRALVQYPLPRLLRDSSEVVRWVYYLLLAVFMPYASILLGFWVVIVRPRDRLAWILLLLLGASSQLDFGYADRRAWEDWIRVPAIVFQQLLAPAWAVAMMLFGIYFPKRWSLDQRFPYLRWFFVAGLGVFAVLGAAAHTVLSESGALLARLQEINDGTARLRLGISLPAIGLFFAALHWKRATTHDADERRRLRIMIAGSTASLTPLFLLVLYYIFGGAGIREEVFLLAALPLVLFPITMAYVILVHRALDVRLAVRQSLQYALARGGMIVILGCAVFAVILYVTHVATEPGVRRVRVMGAVAQGFAVLLLLQYAARQHVVRWIDRRFFREAVEAETVLAELGENVRSIVEPQSLLETVARKIADSLHVTRVAIVLRGNGRFAPAHALGFDAWPDVGFSPDSGTIGRLGAHRRPLRVYLEAEDTWVWREDVSSAERAALEQLHAELLLPLPAKEKLEGFISLGPKKSEEAYSGSDVHLLQSVAAQTGLALENSRLAAEVAQQAALRERFNRELEIAREVQEKLFPQSKPEVPGVDFDGTCRPARLVGGDYFDFISLPDGDFGIAIGDVSGKGIPAALLMASLQASLRGQTIGGAKDLAVMMANINRLIYDASPSNRYATFFYAEYAPASRQLTYVNCGHNPPLLFRGEEVIRLEAGGPMVGLFRPAKYEQAALALAPGDVLVAFTDGVSEAMNAAEEDWSEDRLIETVRACRHLSAAEIIPRIIAAADAFVAGAPQHDDMTLLVLRVK